jgi:hypothetical protein
MDLPAYREDLIAQRLAWAEHARIARAWNSLVDSAGARRNGADLLTFLLTHRDDSDETFSRPRHRGIRG